MQQSFFKIIICFYFIIVINTSVCISCQLSFDGLTYSASDIESGNFSIELSKRFTQKDIFIIKDEIANCRSNILKNIREKQDTLFQLNNDKSKLIGSHNIKDLISRIQTLKKELNDIQQPLQTETNKVPFMGLYAALIESDINISQETLITTAKQKIAEYAIEKVKTEISSHTIVQNNQIILDKVTSKSSGEMQLYDKLDDERTFTSDKTQLLYIAVVNVYPLKSYINEGYREHFRSDSYVVDLISEGIPDWFIDRMTDLLGSKITRQKVNTLYEVVKRWKKIVEDTNTESLQTQNDILKKVNHLMQDKKDEISTAESTLYQTRRILKNIYKSLAFHCYQQPEGCLDDALAQMDKKIKTVVNEYIKESQKEKAQDGKIVPVSSDPASDMKPVVMNLYRTVKEEYCKKEQVIRTSVLNKGYMTEDIKKTGFYITKQPETIYIYPYIKNRNMFVLLVMGFKVIRDGGKTYLNSIYATTDKPNLKTHISKKYYLRSKSQTLSDNYVKKILDEFVPKKYIDNDYKDNNDGTVTDYSTGLLWQKEGSDNDMTFEDAKEYIANLNRSKWGGYSDWRLPTLDELVSILEEEKSHKGLYIDSTFSAKQNWCWSADNSGYSTFIIKFDDGIVLWFDFDYHYVRAVRSFPYNDG